MEWSLDFYDLKKGIKETLEEYDHVLLNEIIEFPSSEYLCQHIHSRLLNRFGFPLKVRVWGRGRKMVVKWITFFE